MNKLIYKGNLNDFKTFAGVGVTKGNWNERALKYFQYLGATSNSFNTAQKEIEEANLETLRLDFVNQDYAVGSADTGAIETTETFDSLLTFTRGSTGTYFDSAGVLQTAAVDEPRFTHDPDTLEAEGLLIEEQRTNLLTYSVPDAPEPTNWTDFVAGSVGKTLVTLDNGIEGIRFQSSSDRPRISQSVSCSGSTTYTVSVYVNPGWSSGTPDNQILRLLSNGTSAPDVRATLDDVDSENRVSLSITTPSDATNVIVQYGPGISGNVSGHDVTMGGVQLEQGSFPTSYIKTEGSQVTRSADNCSRTLGSEFNASEGTILTEVFDDTLSDRASYFSTASTGNGQVFGILRIGGNILAATNNLSVSGDFLSVPAQSGIMKAAFSWTEDSISLSLNGSTTITTTPAAANIIPASLEISMGLSPSAPMFLSKNTKIYPRALSATELQELTA